MGWQPAVEGKAVSDCPECGGRLMWAGLSYATHSTEYHAGVRRRLLRAVRLLLDREADVKAWRAELSAQGLVGIRWRCGVYPGWQSEGRTTVPQEMWDLGQHWRQAYLRDTRWALAIELEMWPGVEVNPATWFHKIYDERVPEWVQDTS